MMPETASIARPEAIAKARLKARYQGKFLVPEEDLDRAQVRELGGRAGDHEGDRGAGRHAHLEGRLDEGDGAASAEIGGDADRGGDDRPEPGAGAQARGRPFPGEELVEEGGEDYAPEEVGSGLVEAPAQAGREVADSRLAPRLAAVIEGAEVEELAVPEEEANRHAGRGACDEAGAQPEEGYWRAQGEAEGEEVRVDEYRPDHERGEDVLGRASPREGGDEGDSPVHADGGGGAQDRGERALGQGEAGPPDPGYRGRNAGAEVDGDDGAYDDAANPVRAYPPELEGHELGYMGRFPGHGHRRLFRRLKPLLKSILISSSFAPTTLIFERSEMPRPSEAASRTWGTWLRLKPMKVRPTVSTATGYLPATAWRRAAGRQRRECRAGATLWAKKKEHLPPWPQSGPSGWFSEGSRLPSGRPGDGGSIASGRRAAWRHPRGCRRRSGKKSAIRAPKHQIPFRSADGCAAKQLSCC